MKIKNHDLIIDLPTDDDESVIVENELQILNMVFKENPSTFKSIFKEFYESLIVAILFIIFSLPYIDNVVNSIIPISNNYYFLIGIKSIMVMILFWIIKNFNYSRSIKNRV